MRKTSILTAVVLLCAVALSAEEPKRGAVDWIFVVDTSQSMRGVGGTEDIFERVKNSIRTFVGEAKDGDSITIYSFDRGVRFWGSSTIGGSFDREELNAIVTSLAAEGDRTHLGLAIQTGLSRSKHLLAKGDPSRERAIVLFTDGLEDVRGISNPVSIPSNIPLVPEVRPWIFFVSVGQHDPGLAQFASHPDVGNRAFSMPADNAAEIAERAREIRTVIEEKAAPPPPPPPTPANVTFAPQAIDFGELEEGETSKAFDLTIRSDQPAQVVLRLRAAEGVQLNGVPDKPLALDPATPSKISVVAALATDAPAGRKQSFLSIDPAPGERRPINAGSVSMTTTVLQVPLWRRLVKWLAWLALIALLLLFALCVIYRDTPAGLVKRLGDGKHLEGAIEILKPRVPAETDSYIGLPALRAKESKLSTIVPPGIINDGDARLLIKRRNGKKEMWISRDQGALRVNNIEVGETPLFDEDTIELGGATLRFTWAGHERPPADDTI